jgi:hypothetical protein
MAAPDPLAGTPEAFISSDWLEAVTSIKQGADMVSRTSGEAILTAKIPAIKVRGCQRFCLGWDATTGTTTGTGGSTFSISRTNPIFHPRLPNLYCTSCSSNEFAPNASSLIIPSNPSVTNPPNLNTLSRRANYKTTTITLRFEPIPYTFLEDGQITQGEWQRNSWIDTEPKTEILSLDGFQMIYTEGNVIAPGSLYSSPIGKAYPGSIGQLLVKPDISVGWDLVPETYIMNSGTFLPGNILSGLGCVNATAWQGYPAGTLLTFGAKLIRKPNTLALKALPGVFSFEPLFLYTVTFLMGYFDPEKGYSDAAGGLGPPQQLIPSNFPNTILGWNNFPWKGSVGVGPPDSTGPFDFNSGLWFGATFDGNSIANGGTALFEEYEYANFFASPNNTA